jgi:hypothetical protein
MSALFQFPGKPPYSQPNEAITSAAWRMQATSHLPAVVPDDLAPWLSSWLLRWGPTRVPSGAVVSPGEGYPSTWNATRAIT